MVANGDVLNPAIRLLIHQRMLGQLDRILEMITEKMGLRVLGGVRRYSLKSAHTSHMDCIVCLTPHVPTLQLAMSVDFVAPRSIYLHINKKDFQTANFNIAIIILYLYSCGI